MIRPEQVDMVLLAQMLEEIDIIDEDNGKNYITQLKVVSGKPVLEYEEVL